MRLSRLQLTGVVLLLALHLGLALGGSWNKSFTADEPAHLNYGLEILESMQVDRSSAQRMPVTMLNTVPLKLTGHDRADRGDELAARRLGRWVTAVLSLLLGLGIFTWSRQLFGPRAGLFSLALYAVSPNILAHAGLATNDIHTALSTFLTVWMLWRHRATGSRRYALVSAFSLGIALGCKFSTVVLVPVIVLLGCLGLAGQGDADRQRHKGRHRAARAVGLAAAYVVIALLALNLVYLGSDPFVPLENFEFRSPVMAGVQEAVPWLALPLPRVYVKGFEISAFLNDSSHGRGYNYILGQSSDRGFWYFYLVSLGAKLPLGTMAIFLLALGASLARTRQVTFGNGVGRFRSAGLFLFLPPMVWLLVFSFFCNVQLGIRYILPAFPFALVWAGVAVRERNGTAGRWMSGAAMICLGFTVLSTAHFFPDYIAYTNEAVRPCSAHMLIADSNLDWGQDLEAARRYADTHGITIDPALPRAGAIITGASRLAGAWCPPHLGWLRDHFPPTGHFHRSYLLHQVEEQRLVDLFGLDHELEPMAVDEPREPGLHLVRLDKEGRPLGSYLVNSIRLTPTLAQASEGCRWVAWTGFIAIRLEGRYAFQVQSSGQSSLTLNGMPVLATDVPAPYGPESVDQAILDLTPGLYEVHAQIQLNPDRAWSTHRVLVGFIDGRPLDQKSLYRRTTSSRPGHGAPFSGPAPIIAPVTLQGECKELQVPLTASLSWPAMTRPGERS